MDRTALLASLTATATADDAKGFYLSEVDPAAESYFDWSTATKDTDGTVTGCRMEIGDEDGDAVQVELTRSQVAELHKRLTLWLLAH